MTKYFIEIRNRLFLTIMCSLGTVFVSYFYKEVLLFIMVEPCTINQNQDNCNIYYFIFTNITDLFLVYFKLVTFITLQLLVPFTIIHIFNFLTPALYFREYKTYFTFIKLSCIFWVISWILLSCFIVPITWFFFSNFQNLVSSKFINIHFEAKLNEYFDFYFSMYYICVFYCQIFATLIFLFSLNFNLKSIKKFRKLYYFIFVILSTLISPPDIFSQIGFSLSMVVSYEFLVINFILKNVLAR